MPTMGAVMSIPDLCSVSVDICALSWVVGISVVFESDIVLVTLDV